MRRAGSIRRLQINFVVQEENYRELLEFVELGIRMDVDSIWLQRVTNYGAYAEGAFAKADVTSPEHPHHNELLDILRHPVMSHPAVDMQMLMPLLPEVVASDLRLPLLHSASRIKAEELRWGGIDAHRRNAPK
jgi:MoaA/NifB/PqqE/SkfB family radical SAM enzyme